MSVIFSKAGHLKRSNNTGNDLRKLMESWDGRFLVKGSALAEDYINHRFAIALVVEVSAAFWANQSNRITPNPQRAGRVGGRIIIILDYCQLPVVADTHHRKQTMLVHPVKLVQRNQLVTSAVRLLHFDDDFSKVRSGALYRSEFTFAYKRIPIIVDWEVYSLVCFSSCGQDDLVCDVVEGGSQIVNDVAHYWRHSGEQTEIAGAVNEMESPGLRVFLYGDKVAADFSVGVDQFFKLSDVLVGPFDLRSGASKGFLLKG